MNRVLPALLWVLAFVFCLAESASAYAPVTLENRVGVFEEKPNDYTGEIGSPFQQPCRENTTAIYDPATGVWVYVRQNPWTAFDPLGLFEEVTIERDSSWLQDLGSGLAEGVMNVVTGPYRISQQAVIESEVFYDEAIENGDSSVSALTTVASHYVARVSGSAGLAEAVAGQTLSVNDGEFETNEFSSTAERVTHGTLSGGQMAMTGLGGVVMARSMGLTGSSSRGIAVKNGNCFPEGTLVATPDGKVPIEQLNRGDEVMALDFITGQPVARIVTETVKGHTHYWIEINILDETVTATRFHRFWVESKAKWVHAIDLERGDVLRLKNGDIVSIDLVSHYSVEFSEPTYNLEVSVNHNFFVGRNSILVHNGDTDNRGRIQAQGTSLEESVSWTQEKPPTVSEGLDLVDDLEAKLSKKDAKMRKDQFKRARRFIQNAGNAGGVDAPVSKTFQVPGTAHERVDIEVIKGKAFVPDGC